MVRTLVTASRQVFVAKTGSAVWNEPPAVAESLLADAVLRLSDADPLPTTRIGSVGANRGENRCGASRLPLPVHDDENLAPAEPETPKGRPEQSVQGQERRPAFLFEDSDLLARGEDLKSRIGPAAEEDSNQGEDGENA